MPVQLPALPSPARWPSPPKPIVWLALFVVFMLAGAALTLLTWPKNESTSSAWFWTRLLAFPALAWCTALGLRLFYYDEETARLRAEEATLEADRLRAIEFAREPLAVLGSPMHAHWVAMASRPPLPRRRSARYVRAHRGQARRPFAIRRYR